jgi:7-carboxy-7-deazaguanine synthase
LSYHFAEIFFSLQGEGHRAGTANVFVRFAGCNLQCNVAEHGFDCDTDFSRKMTFKTAEEVLHEAEMVRSGSLCKNVIFTGGEPGLQLDDALVEAFKSEGWHVAVETNGMYRLPTAIDWVSCSPKRGITRDQIKVRFIDELRYVVEGMYLPPGRSHVNAKHLFLSPAFDVASGEIKKAALEACINLCKEFPMWRMSVQQHKGWGVR